MKENESTHIVKVVQPEEIMSKERAFMLTEDIKSTTSALYILLKQAHDEKAWIALGYKTWTEYVENEFNFSRSRSYQLLNQAKVIEEINDASGVAMYITEREARAIKKRLPQITEKIKNENTEGKTEEEVEKRVKEIIEEEDEREDIDNAENHGAKHPRDEDVNDDEFYSPTDRDGGGYKGDKLSENDKFFYENLLLTLKIFTELPEASEFGRKIKNSENSKKELIKLSESAFAWITQLLDEIE